MTTSKKDTFEVIGSGPESPFDKDATELCRIWKDIDCFVLNTPRGIKLPLSVNAHFWQCLGDSILDWVFLNDVLSAVISSFMLCI